MNTFGDQLNDTFKHANQFDHENLWIQEHSNSMSQDDIDNEEQEG